MTDATSPAGGNMWDAESARREGPDFDDTSGYGDVTGSEPLGMPDSGGASAWPGRPGAAHPAGWFPPAPGDAAPPGWPVSEPARTDAGDHGSPPVRAWAPSDPAHAIPGIPGHIVPGRVVPGHVAPPGAWQEPSDSAARPPRAWREPQQHEPWPAAPRPDPMPRAWQAAPSQGSPWQDVLDEALPQVPVVGPTDALRGWAGGPGFAAPQAAPPAPQNPSIQSGWQRAQQLWQQSGISWEAPAAEPEPVPEWSQYPPDSFPAESWPYDGSEHVVPPYPHPTAPQPGFVAVPPRFAATSPAFAPGPPPQFAAAPQGAYPAGPASGFAAMPLGAPTRADIPVADPMPPWATRPPLNEPDELYRAWQGSVRRASASPRLTARRRRQAWQVLRVGVPAAVIVSVGAGAVIMLTAKPGQVIAESANQANTGAAVIGVSAAPAAGTFSGYPGQRGALTVSSIASADGTQLAVGSADGRPAIWRHAADGDWTLVSAAAPAFGRRPGTENLTSIAHGPSGWIAVGEVISGAAQQPIVLTSADGVTWQPVSDMAAFAGPDTYVTAVTAGRDGYVVVGRQVSAGRVFGAMWWSADLRSWVHGSNGGLDGRLEPSAAYAVAALGTGFVAAGTHGSRGAIWTSADGRQWTVHDIPAPAGASAPVLRLVAVNGSRIVAAGYAVTARGEVPIVVVSADGGRSWQQVPLATSGTGSVTALTAAGPGFIAAGQAGPAGAQRPVTWSSPDGLSWSAATIADGGGRQITALSASGGTVTGIAQQAAGPSVVTLPAP